MEYFILGLLMVFRQTAYELHVRIRDNYQGICSPSIGNIQRALKKLHEKGFVSLEEVKEGKVVKKIFSITPTGRAEFMKWLNQPIKIVTTKNMELGRLLLLGFLTREQQLTNIDLMIQDLTETIEYLNAVEATIKAELEVAGGDAQQFLMAFFNDNQSYMEEMLDAVESDNFLEVMKNVRKFGNFVLEFGIAELKFNLEWFQNLKKRLESEE